jgi:hypothetical protein
MKLSICGLAVSIVAVSGAAGLAGCAEYGPYAYGPPPPYADVDFYGFYDDYYGPFVGGYWGPGGDFYYWDRGHGKYRRDTGHHFRRDANGGYHAIQGHAPPAAHGGHPSGPR